MIVLRCIVDLEHYGNLRIEELDVEGREVGLRIEDQPVGAAGKWLFNQEEGFDPPVFIGPRMAELGPAFVRVLQVQVDSYAAGGRATRDIEYVRGDGAHPLLVRSLQSGVVKSIK